MRPKHKKNSVGEDRLERLLRERIEEVERAVDADAIVASVKQRIAESRGTAETRPRRRFIRVVWKYAAAAAVLIALLFGIHRYARMPDAVAEIRAASATFEKQLDRLYSVLYIPPRELRRGYPLLFYARHAMMWLRGDKFCVKVTRFGKTFYWGSEGAEAGIWVVGDKGIGLRLREPDGVNKFTGGYQIRTMQVNKIVKALEPDYDLRTVGVETLPVGEKRRCIHIEATLKSGKTGHPFDKLDLYVDEETKEIRKISIRLLYRGRNIGTLVMQLVKAEPADDSRYDIHTYMPPDGIIIEGSRAALRALSMHNRFKQSKE